jgi:hypothetical protein
MALTGERLKSEAAELRTEIGGARTDGEQLEQSISGAAGSESELDLIIQQIRADQLILVSSKNGEIAGLKEEKAETTLEAEKYKGAFRSRLFIIIALYAGFSGSYKYNNRHYQIIDKSVCQY